MKIAIYICITGGYDPIYKPLRIESGIGLDFFNLFPLYF